MPYSCLFRILVPGNCPINIHIHQFQFSCFHWAPKYLKNIYVVALLPRKTKTKWSSFRWKLIYIDIFMSSLLLFLHGNPAHMLIFGHVLKIFNAKTAQRDETGRPGRFIKISSSTFCLFSHCVHDAMKWKSMQMHSPQHHGNNYNDNEDEWAWWWWWRWVWVKRTFCHWSAHRGNEHFATANGDRL